MQHSLKSTSLPTTRSRFGVLQFLIAQSSSSRKGVERHDCTVVVVFAAFDYYSRHYADAAKFWRWGKIVDENCSWNSFKNQFQNRAIQNRFLTDFVQWFWIGNFEGHFRVIMKVVTQNCTQKCKKISWNYGPYLWGFEFLPAYIKLAELVADWIGIHKNNTHMPFSSSEEEQYWW